MAKISKSNIIIGRFQARSYFRENPSKQSKTKNKNWDFYDAFGGIASKYLDHLLVFVG